LFKKENYFLNKKHLIPDFPVIIVIEIWTKSDGTLCDFFFQNKLGWVTCQTAPGAMKKKLGQSHEPARAGPRVGST
jgi:hypothetical protein